MVAGSQRSLVCGMRVGLVACLVAAGVVQAAGETTSNDATPTVTPLVQPAAQDAQSDATPAPAAQPAVSETAAAPVVAPVTPSAKPAMPEDDVRAQLEGTRWAVNLMPLGGADKAKPRQDAVLFTGKTVSSESLTKAGYPGSNYSLTIEDGGMATWETMQTKEGEGVVFWKGEVNGSKLQGVLSKHPANAAPEDFSFSGVEASGKVIVVPPKDGEATSQSLNVGQPVQEPAAASNAESSTASAGASQATGAAPKKKRGLFGR